MRKAKNLILERPWFSLKSYCFIENLARTIDDEVINLGRYRTTGQNGRRPQHRACVRADEKISECQRLLATGRYFS